MYRQRFTMLFLFTWMGIGLANPLSAGVIHDSAQLLLTNGRIYTGDSAQPPYEAMAIRDGKVVAGGSSQDLKKWQAASTKVIDLKGKSVYPGFHEGHGHLLGLGRMLIELNLVGLTSLETVQKKIAAEMAKTAKGEWIRGRGWDQNLWPRKEFPTKQDLDSLGADRPVILSRVDGHAVWVNSLALKIAGISSKTLDPVGGKIIRDSQGEPTGILLDGAMGLVQKLVPPQSLAQQKAAIVAAMRLCLESGITSFHDAGTDAGVIAIYESLLAQGELPLRLNVMLSGSDEKLLDSYMKSGPVTKGNDHLQIRTVKLMADGALGSRGAVLLEPYTDQPGYSGLEILSEEQIYQATRRFAAAGFQTATHAIGDKANRSVLNAYERVIKEHPGQQLRLRVEHAQILDVQDIPRFGKLGIIASIQPTHLTSDAPWVPTRIGAARMDEGAYVWQKIRKGQALVVSGSDAPVESVNPLLGLYAAITRQTPEGKPSKAWSYDQHLSVEEAIESYTSNAAYAAFWEDKLGTLTVGKYADFVVLDQDIKKLVEAGRAKELVHDKVLMTAVAGKILYQAPGISSH